MKHLVYLVLSLLLCAPAMGQNVTPSSLSIPISAPIRSTSVTTVSPDTATPGLVITGLSAGGGNSSPMLEMDSPTSSLKFYLGLTGNYNQALWHIDSTAQNVIAFQNDSLTGYSAATFRGADPKYVGKTPFEHMAIGWGNNLGFNYIESSSYDTTANPLMPPSKFIIQQTGGVDPTGGTNLACNTTNGSPTITCPANSIPNGRMVIGPGIPTNPFPTVLSGGGTTTMVLTGNATADGTGQTINFSNPSYAQRDVIRLNTPGGTTGHSTGNDTGDVEIVNWDNTINVKVDRWTNRTGFGATTNTLRNTIDVYGGGTFGTTTSTRNTAGIVGVVTVFDASANQLRLDRTGVSILDVQINGTTGAASADFVDTTNSAVVPFSIKLDATKTTVQAGPTYYTGVVKTTPSTGGTVTYATTQRTALIVPAGTLATLTLTLPACAAANDGDERDAIFSQIITTLTVNASAGSVVGASSSAAVGGGHAYHCYGADTTWYQKY